MRKIKFRGYDTADGVRENVTFSLNELLAVSDGYELVDPDSVAQLVGFDCDGREVYEGDILVDTGGNEHVARLESTAQNTDTAELHFWTYPSKLKIKENQHVED